MPVMTMLSSALTQRNDEISHVLLEQKRGLRIGNLLEGKCLRHQGADLLAFDVTDQGCEYAYRYINAPPRRSQIQH